MALPIPSGPDGSSSPDGPGASSGSPGPSTPSPEAPDPRERWLFLLSGALLLLALLVAIGRERRWGESQVPVHVVAARADGLQEGMEVRLSGMPIGRVESLQLQNDARVAATLQIHSRHRHLIGPRSRAQSGQVGLVGPTFLTLTPDPQPEGKGTRSDLPTLTYDPPPDLNQLVADLGHSRQQLDQTLALASHLLRHQVPPSLASLRKGTTQLSGSMADLSALTRTISGETRRTLPPVRELTASLRRESGQIGPAVRRTLTKVDDTLTRADQTADSAAKASREAEQLLRQARPSLIPTLANVQEITGSLTQLVRFLGGLGLLEPGTARPRSAPPPSPSEGMDPHKAHPTAPPPSPPPP